MTSLTYGSANRGSAARSQRLVAFATIAGLHALVLAVILSGFGKVAMQIMTGEIQARIIDPPNDTRETLPPPPPALTRVAVDAGPPPLFPIDIDGGGENAITAPLVEQTPPAPVAIAPPAPLPIHVVGKHRLPNTDEYYPAKDIRDRVEGVSTVGVCVDASGKRSSEPKVVESSGSASLDAGALRVLRDGRYARAMQGEQYVPNCYQFRIIFELNER